MKMDDDQLNSFSSTPQHQQYQRGLVFATPPSSFLNERPEKQSEKEDWNSNSNSKAAKACDDEDDESAAFSMRRVRKVEDHLVAHPTLIRWRIVKFHLISLHWCNILMSVQLMNGMLQFNERFSRGLLPTRETQTMPEFTAQKKVSSFLKGGLNC